MDGTLDAPRTQVASDPVAGNDLSARQALQLIALACAQQIQAHEPRLRRSRSPEALHQTRVALRRWRTALSVFGPAAGAGREKARATLKWLTGELNEARDLDVFAAAFAPSRTRDEGARALADALDTARADAYGRADEALQCDRVRRLLWRTAQAGGRGAGEGDPMAREVVAAALERRRRKLKKRGRHLQRLACEDRHRLRIEAKKVRYAIELCGEMFGHLRRQARMGKALKRMQDALGSLNDLAVGEAVALKLAKRAATPDAAFAAGLVSGSRACREEADLLRAAAAAYDDFVEVERFW